MDNIVHMVGVFRVQGKIISFNVHERQGIIIADDGIQYIFHVDSWVSPEAPRAGENIDFTFSETGQVNKVTRLFAQAGSMTPPPIPPNLSKSPSHNAGQYATSTSDFNHQNFNNPSINNQFSEDVATIYAQEENYNLIDWAKKVILNNYANFNNRARRKEYWLYYVASIILNFGAMFVDFIFGMVIGNDIEVFYLLFNLAIFVPTLAVGARRLHDTGRSGWWQLLWFIPIIGWILLIIWLATETSPQTNKWGAPAKRV